MTKPHLIYRNGYWQLYRNKWKSRWPTSGCIAGRTIPEIQDRLTLRDDAWKYGGFALRTAYMNLPRDQRRQFREALHERIRLATE